ncbi:hypothetical protein JG688_00016403, partial [Phytophthora aleatoria]
MVPTKVPPKPPMAGKESATKGRNEKNSSTKVVEEYADELSSGETTGMALIEAGSASL